MSPNPSFQTIRLSRGRHLSPGDGACVMELSSMLADERFTDHPSSVCPVVAMVMRAYNDGIDDDRRQDLYAYAAACVGTRDRRARAARLRRCEEFYGERGRQRPFLRRSRMHAIGRAALEYGRDADGARHAAFLALVDELIGASPRVPAEAPRGVPA